MRFEIESLTKTWLKEDGTAKIKDAQRVIEYLSECQNQYFAEYAIALWGEYKKVFPNNKSVRYFEQSLPKITQDNSIVKLNENRFSRVDQILDAFELVTKKQATPSVLKQIFAYKNAHKLRSTYMFTCLGFNITPDVLMILYQTPVTKDFKKIKTICNNLNLSPVALNRILVEPHKPLDKPSA